MEALRRDFFWNGRANYTGGVYLVAWKTVCRSRKEGGLGVKDLAIMNDALLTKWWWRFHNEKELQWVKLITRLYYNRRRPLFEGRTFRPASQWWKNVLDLKELFKCGLCYELGNGISIDFWSDRWCGDASLKLLFPDIYSLDVLKEVRVSNCFSASGWRWRKTLRGVRRNTHLSKRNIIVFKNTLANIQVKDQPDVIHWRWDSSNTFTVKSTYSLLTLGGVKDGMMTAVWRLKLPTKVKIFLWLAFKKRLPTVDNLLKRGWSGNNSCVLCGVELETIDHLLVGCITSKFLFFSILDSPHFFFTTDDVNIIWEEVSARGSPVEISKILLLVAAI